MLQSAKSCHAFNEEFQVRAIPSQQILEQCIRLSIRTAEILKNGMAIQYMLNNVLAHHNHE